MSHRRRHLKDLGGAAVWADGGDGDELRRGITMEMATGFLSSTAPSTSSCVEHGNSDELWYHGIQHDGRRQNTTASTVG
ncbi:hypothetical protein E2562_022637 [Oryza meyeriana var. granulata]|uniref:Uncharacterized protein n=1 Tax=Oryza meyeriana var. granulata TaxID=110450 RepID=A0A6G1CSA0_9ORYZ|nr:hypothetical protein E2562_022636 [Oryza meyeriana var. granulata]KAF0903012.1 hypothetical protein E2562_022637 [Oryza meyeriana var. granulata]